ncbi:MAG TPA: Fic family protein [Xanthomonadaceae bacterium]|nr:Fic family protein [Xanthomonadaceae bacterium]
MDAGSAPAPTPYLYSRLERAFEDTRIKEFVSDARSFPDAEALVVRKHNVCLKTTDSLTSRFRPPFAADVGPVLSTCLKATQESLRRVEGNAAKVAICAQLGSQILLTIHPFQDGNGRTARMFFAANLLKRGVAAPTALLGMMLMYRSGSHQYHQASWEFRAGNVEPMVRLFAESTALAQSRLMQHVTFDRSPENFLAHCWHELRAIR